MLWAGMYVCPIASVFVDIQAQRASAAGHFVKLDSGLALGSEETGLAAIKVAVCLLLSSCHCSCHLCNCWQLVYCQHAV